MEAIMAQGTVKFYNAQKGYGFIQPDDGGKDVFVHATALEAAGIYSLAEGQKVSFELVESRGKMAAGQLRTV
jgi:CspA family cold shock protein